MFTASSQSAMTFSAAGHVVAWGLDFGGQMSSSEIRGKNCNSHVSETVFPGAEHSTINVLVDKIHPTRFDQTRK